MAFTPEKKVARIKKNLAISPTACQALADLAEIYGTTEGKVIEALLDTYGPSLIREARGKK